MKTQLLKMKGDWCEIIDDCRSTVSKPPLGREPSTDFKKRILIAEHSPIRDISFRWKWTGIKYWIAMHWKTHHWESKVSTQRTDRTGVDRNKLPQDAPVDFVGEANVQHFIDTMRKRLYRNKGIRRRFETGYHGGAAGDWFCTLPVLCLSRILSGTKAVRVLGQTIKEHDERAGL